MTLQHILHPNVFNTVVCLLPLSFKLALQCQVWTLNMCVTISTCTVSFQSKVLSSQEVRFRQNN